MKIVVAGTRGIPNIQGGVETHCEELYPRLAAMGHDVTVVRRSCYVTPQNKLQSYKGVRLKDIYAPRKKSIEAIVHTFLAILYARRVKADVLHIHAIGPALLTPFARLLGLKVVMTHHGPDYDRQKWNKLAKTVLRMGERMGARYANEVIVISTVIDNILREKYHRCNAHLIYNGVNTPTPAQTTDYIASLGLEPHKYVLAVGRFVEEKGFDLLVKAFDHLLPEGYKLVIAGDADHEDRYSTSLKQLARERGVVLTGFIRGAKLNELFSHARLFVLPSFHEGLPIVLLEALSYRLPVLVSDIPANRLACLPTDDFFTTGDIGSLEEALARKLAQADVRCQYDLSPYNWDYIARQVDAVYHRL
ncbi:glycosyltransferase family 4 protein [Barnesiella sp. An55]|uniref:glycosyltransferase family 4 protein n=1 Tax=Barnesiella sp. An55 TaxID=1965646 RepID=UPI000B366802|nr:glycosyltransferase family 4 protein [Barnesiella sp. An55]OUN73031.1 glycosyl transferase family 1 [Barnesiella sp. An55]